MYFVTKTVQVQAVVRMCSVKKVLLKILQNSQENTCVKVSFLIKLQLYEKETLKQVFSRKFCGILNLVDWSFMD